MRHPTPSLQFTFIPQRMIDVLVFQSLLLVFLHVVLEAGFAYSQDVKAKEKTVPVAHGNHNVLSDPKLSSELSTETKQGGSALLGSGNCHPEQMPGYRESRYDRIAWLVTHNAMSNRAEGWWFPNQSFGITRQLQDGVRGLMLDVHLIDGEPFLLHSSAMLGKTPLGTGLAEIEAFLQKHADVIVTVILECYVPAAKVRDAFEKAGLLSMLHHQTAGNPWPGIDDMIAGDKRLVVFTDSGGGEWRGYHDVWKFCQETHYSVKRVEDFDFKRNRGHASNSLFILNHFLTRPVAGMGLAMQANASSVLKPRIEGCEKATMRFPNFVVVDFYECGDTPALLADFNLETLGKQKSDLLDHADRSDATLKK